VLKALVLMLEQRHAGVDMQVWMVGLCVRHGFQEQGESSDRDCRVAADCHAGGLTAMGTSLALAVRPLLVAV
jgi:hypothetical protein